MSSRIPDNYTRAFNAEKLTYHAVKRVTFLIMSLLTDSALCRSLRFAAWGKTLVFPQTPLALLDAGQTRSPVESSFK